MIEKILVNIILYKTKFIEDKEYNNKLNKFFNENSDNDLLLDLEMCSKDSKKSWAVFQKHFFENKLSYNYDILGKNLFEELKKIYNSKKINIKEFGIKSYEVWKLLPNEIMQKEPFWTLEYADDCISWGDEEQTRKLYEKAFEYYSDIK